VLVVLVVKVVKVEEWWLVLIMMMDRGVGAGDDEGRESVTDVCGRWRDVARRGHLCWFPWPGACACGLPCCELKK
jgi:hypothetical protein